MMKVFGFCVLFLLLGTALLLSDPSVPGVTLRRNDDNMAIAATSRKLKGNSYHQKNSKTTAMDLEDYHPIDPAPSSKAKIKPGPIEHGTPLNPYIPRPPPPGHPKICG